MHLTSLPGPHGIGEIGRDARHLIDQLAEAGLSVWQFLPTGPTAYGDSPYQPLSVYAGNAMLIELRELVEMNLLLDTELAPLAELPSEHVEYGALIAQKSILLARAAERFFAAPRNELHDAFDAFVAANDEAWLNDYALYRTLKSMHDDRAWPDWPSAYRRRHPDALASIASQHAARISGYKFAQFLFFRQWRALQDHARGRGVQLFGDMPIYIALDCADAWSHPELLRIDRDGKPSAVAGVPPDYFSADGQLWGNPLYDWEYHQRTGYSWWVERIRHTLRMVDIVRIDHFRGFEAYWAVPNGAITARDGRWEQGPNDALFDAIRDALGELPIVAEDLGDITPAVHELRRRQQLPGMSVLQFMIGEHDFDAASIGVDAVCYTGTHDNDTTLGWFNGQAGSDTRSADEIRNIQQHTLAHAGGDPGDVHWSLIRVAFKSQACIAIVPMQDFLGLGSEARLNTPGKPANNWRWRLTRGAFDAALRKKIAALAKAAAR